MADSNLKALDLECGTQKRLPLSISVAPGRTRTSLAAALPTFVYIVFVFFFLLLPPQGEAGIYHTSGTDSLACSQCHSMHGSQGNASIVYDTTLVPYPKLLKLLNAYELCLHCHEKNKAGLLAPTPPDVLNNNSLTEYVASAGDFEHGGVENWQNKHDLGVTAAEPPGYNSASNDGKTWATVQSDKGSTFTCVYCHDQHGNANYRNLRYNPVNTGKDAASGTEGTDFIYISYGMITVSTGSPTSCYGSPASPPCDVVNLYDSEPANNLVKYYRENVMFAKTSGFDYNRISRWCGFCHSDFFGVSDDSVGGMGGFAAAGVGEGDANSSGTVYPWNRHPVGDVNIGNGDISDLHSSTSGLDYPSELGTARYANEGSDDLNGDEQPFCLTCHYAHGGGNPTGTELDHTNLVMVDADGDVNMARNSEAEGSTSGVYSENTGFLRNVCQQCHNQ